MKFQHIYFEANQKFIELDEKMKNNIGRDGGNKDHSRSGFLSDKKMNPKAFDKDIAIWRRWKEEVTNSLTASRRA